VVSKLLSSRFRMLASSGVRALLVIGLLGTASLAFSQTERGWTAEIGGGFTPVVGALSERLDNGWNIRVGGGYNITSHFSTGIEYRWNGLGVGSSVLREANVPGGNSHVWSIGLVPRLSFSPHHGINPYVVGDRWILPPRRRIHSTYSSASRSFRSLFRILPGRDPCGPGTRTHYAKWNWRGWRVRV
jgi:hypothetical protein